MARLGWRGGFAAVAVLALVATGLAQQSGAPTGLKDSQCWTCHKAGGTADSTPLASMYSILPPSELPLRTGEPLPLRVTVRNDWTATLHHIAGVLDLSDAPALAFEPVPEPILGVARSGVLPLDPAAAAQPERAAIVTVPIPAGATDVRVELVPDRATGPDAPDLAMRIWGDGADPDRSAGPDVTVDAGANGAAERFHPDPAGIAALGYGNWSVAAVQRGLTQDPDPAALREQGFTVRVDAWFNLTGERTQVAASTARLDGQGDGPQTTTLEWRLFVQRAPGPGESLRLRVDAVASYEHPRQFGAVDDWTFTQELAVPIQVPVGQDPKEPVTTIVLNTTPPAPPPAVTAVSLLTERSIGEIVGYFTTFTLALSLATGGILGAPVRRGLNSHLGSAQRRVALHNLASYGVILAAIAHTWLFLHETEFPWTLGLLWGGLAILALALLGVTGAWQLGLIRAWGYKPWQRIHLGSAWLASLTIVAHVLLDGIHFQAIQDAVGWRDPFAP